MKKEYRCKKCNKVIENRVNKKFDKSYFKQGGMCEKCSIDSVHPQIN